MLNIHRPNDSEIMAQMRRSLEARRGWLADPVGRMAELRDLVGPAPSGFEKPRFGTPSYGIAAALGWIDAEEQRADQATYEARVLRSLQSCHRHSLYERRRFSPPKESGGYVPEASARIEDDRNLTDGARRCARKIMEETYRANRDGRELDITVTYLARGLGRCRRTIQRYLRLLEREGYIGVEVVKGARSRLCTGLAIRLLAPMFPRHHSKKWPAKLGNPGATRKSQNQRTIDLQDGKRTRFAREEWARKCMDGVFRALMATDPLADRPRTASG